MSGILFLAHSEPDGGLGRAAEEALGAAVDLGRRLGAGAVIAGLWGERIEAAADRVAGAGVESILGVTGPEYGVARYGTDAAAASALIREAGAGLVLAPSTSRTNRALPGAAARADGRIDTRVTDLEVADGELRVKRWYYRQRMLATLTRAHRPWVLLLDRGAFPRWEGEAAAARIRPLAVEPDPVSLTTRVEAVIEASSDARTLRPDAELLFVAGAGWTKKQADGQTHAKEAESLILGFLDVSQASLGGSKSLVEQSGEGHDTLTFMTHLNQVGQTGASPRHHKGLATCCHGEEPHVVGWRFVTERRAVNKDPGCGWARGKADVVYVADAFAVMAKVNELLASG